MEDDKKSYPGRDTEREFVHKEKRRNEDDLKIIFIQDVKKRDEERKKIEEKKKCKRKLMTAGILLLSIVVIWISSLVSEFYLIPKGRDLFALGGNLAIEAMVAVIGVVINREEISGSRKFDASWAERMFSVGKALIKVWIRLDICQFIFWLGFCIFVGQMIGKNGWVGDTSRAFQAAIYVFQNEEVEVLSGSETQRPEYTNVLSGKDEETLEQIKEITISQDEKKREMNLSKKDRAIICFEGEEYDISDLEDENEINKIIEAFVMERRNRKRENVFDRSEEKGGAPEAVRGKISEASEKEKEAKSFSGAEEILIEREDVYLKYPKASLAQLIANGYELLALTLLFHGGNAETINYYYGQSILKDFEYLEYDGLSNANIKSRLLKTVQKYEDMKLINPDWETEFPTIGKLRDAFQYVADQY